MEGTSQTDPLVVLFDIDGTLIDSAGAGGGALLSALMQVFGVSEATPVQLHGRTDFGIMTELLQSHGIEASPENIGILCDCYYERLPTTLQSRPGRVLPGVLGLLDKFEAATGCHLGLLTGNMPISAQFKLEHYGLWERFAFGVFGDAALHRTDLSEPAIAAVRKQVADALPTSRVVVIGDTPMDVELALAMSSRSLAVCTGGFEERTLVAAGADKVVPDLSDIEGIMKWCLDDSGGPE